MSQPFSNNENDPKVWTRKVAHLSRLALTPEELETFAPQLEKIRNYMSELSEVSTEGVVPLLNPLAEQGAFLREDVVQEFDSAAILEGAPEADESSFTVPPIL